MIQIHQKYLIAVFLLFSCKSTSQVSRSESLTASNNGRAFGLIQTGNTFRLTECPSLDLLNSSKDQEFSGNDCTDHVTGISAEEKRKVEESLQREIAQLRTDPKMSRFVGQIFPNSEAPLEFLNRALEEFQDPAQNKITNSYIFRNTVNILVEEFNLLRENGSIPLSVFTIPKFFYQAGLIAMLSSRCAHYKISNKDCPHAARDLITTIDFTVANPSNSISLISFPKLTQQYMKDAGTATSLATIEQGLSNISVPYYAKLRETHDADRTLEIMATIFQDTEKTHLPYLYIFTATDDLGSVLSQNLVKTDQLLTQIKQFPRFGALPGIDDPEPNGDRSYHIFVPALAAKKLIRNNRSPELVAQLTFIFNTLYEYAREINTEETSKLFSDIAAISGSAGPNQNVTGDLNQKINSFFAVFQDPDSLEAVDAGTKEDLYYGYVAAMWGTGQPVMNIMKYERFARLFFSEPYDFIANTENFRAQ